MMVSSRIGSIETSSKVYATAPWGNTEQDDFLNVAMICQTNLSAEDVLSEINIIETKLGRTREEKWGSRIIDIDIIFYDEEIIKKPDLIIPHPHLTNRNFVLTPLMDICPEYIHPELQKSVSELHAACTDKSEVNPYKD